MRSPASSITQGRVFREIRLDGVSLTETFHGAGARLPEHLHDRPSLSLVLGGSFEERIDARSFACEPMSLLYKPPGAPHANRYGSAGARTLLVSLDDLQYQRLERFASGSVFSPRMASGLMAGRVLSLFVRTVQGQAAVQDWEEIFARVFDPDAPAPQSAQPRWFRQIEESIQERFAEPLTLSALAEEAGIHPVHLARVYRRTRGCSIGDAIRRRRTEHALKLIRSGEMGLSEIALVCGFSDQSHLTREFRREIGEAPGRLRSSMQSFDQGPCPSSGPESKPNCHSPSTESPLR